MAEDAERSLVPEVGTVVDLVVPGRVVAVDAATPGGPFVEVYVYHRGGFYGLSRTSIWVKADRIRPRPETD